MKKFILFLFIALGFSLTVSAQVSTIKFPAGAASIRTSTTDTITVAFTPTNTVEFLKIDSTTFDVHTTLNLTTTYAKAGYILYVEATAKSGLNLIFGTGMQGVTQAVVDNKTGLIMAVFNGTRYVVVSYKQEN